MTYRLAAPGSNTRGRIVLTSAVVVAALVALERYVAHAPLSPDNDGLVQAPAAQPISTVAPAMPAASTPAAVVVAADGSAVAPERLRGRWTMLFAPSEPCVDACARVLETLAAVAHDPASGVQDGVAQIMLTRPQGKQAAREIVVLDPEGHSAGMISHVNDAGRIVSGLATLRAAYAAGNTTASR
ncbi:MAG TPA: hypothetical protein VFP36_07630 [Usitatibacter sp.]|nr:hypothetical protein [Usitatibacter sp.]